MVGAGAEGQEAGWEGASRGGRKPGNLVTSMAFFLRLPLWAIAGVGRHGSLT
jgi:hypothetical protein